MVYKGSSLVDEHHRDILQEELFPKPESFLGDLIHKNSHRIQPSIRRVNATAILFYNVTTIIIVSPLFTFSLLPATLSALKEHWPDGRPLETF